MFQAKRNIRAANGRFMSTIFSGMAVAIAEARTRAKVEDTGLARSSVTDRLLSRSAEDTTSTKEGITCLFPATTVTLPWSELEPEDEWKELDESYPFERPLAPSHRPPWPPRELRPPPRLLLPTPSP